MHELWRDRDVRRFLFDDRIISLDEARSFVSNSEGNFRDRGYGLWLCREHGDEAIAGFAGFLGGSPAPNLIYGVRSALSGRGYATEAAAAVLGYARTVLGIERVVADVDEPNVGSIRVLEKLGLSRTRRAIVNGRPLLYFATGART